MSEQNHRNQEQSNNSNEASIYDGISRETLSAIRDTAAAASESESDTPMADLRTIVREGLQEAGHENAFRRVYNMNNLELKTFLNGIENETISRERSELESLLSAYDNNDTFADRRTALRETMQENGDEDAFRKLYDMNNLELKSFIEDARQKLNELTISNETSETSETSTDSEHDHDVEVESANATEETAEETENQSIAEEVDPSVESPNLPAVIEEDSEPKLSTSKELELYQRPTFEVPVALADKLADAMTKYAELTARDRRSYIVGRYTKDPRSLTGKLLNKVPGFKIIRNTVVDKLNSKQGEKINDARATYEQIVKDIENAYDEYAKQHDLSEDKIHIGKAENIRTYELSFEKKLAEISQRDSKNTNKFVDWWVSQESFKGKMKKAAVVMGAGAVAGSIGVLVAPAIVATMVGAAAGGTTGGLIANHVTKRRANAKTYARNAEGKTMRDYHGKLYKNKLTVADRQAIEDSKQKSSLIDDYIRDVKRGRETKELGINELTDITEERSNEEAFQNRSRLRKAIALGKLAGGLAGYGAFTINHSETAQAISAPNNNMPAPSPSLKGEMFDVEYGSGYTNELMQFANTNGHQLSPTQAFDLHQHLMNKFGQDYININTTGGRDIYFQNGDVRLSAPGKAEWVKGVTQEAQKWMAGRGLW